MRLNVLAHFCANLQKAESFYVRGVFSCFLDVSISCISCSEQLEKQHFQLVYLLKDCVYVFFFLIWCFVSSMHFSAFLEFRCMWIVDFDKNKRNWQINRPRKKTTTKIKSPKRIGFFKFSNLKKKKNCI